MSYSNLITTYLGAGLLADRANAPEVPGMAFYFGTDTAIMYLWNGSAWSAVPLASSIAETYSSADRTLTLTDNNTIIFVDASASGTGGLSYTVPASFGGPGDPFLCQIARDPTDASANPIAIYDDASPTPNLIDAITVAVNAGQVPSLSLRGNGTRVISLRSAA